MKWVIITLRPISGNLGYLNSTESKMKDYKIARKQKLKYQYQKHFCFIHKPYIK